MERLGKRNREGSSAGLSIDLDPTKRVKLGITNTRKKSQEIELKNLTANGQSEPEDEPVDRVVSEGDFEHFRITPKTIALLQKKGILHLFPIQAKTFDIAFDGLDIIGRDRTGSGKTLAYALPLIEKFRADGVFHKSDGLPKLLVLVPTRELCVQGTLC